MSPIQGLLNGFFVSLEVIASAIVLAVVGGVAGALVGGVIGVGVGGSVASLLGGVVVGLLVGGIGLGAAALLAGSFDWSRRLLFAMLNRIGDL